MKNMQFIDSPKDFLTEEAYNSLRTNIIFCGSEIKTIAITSCFPGEGKSTVSRSLAMNLAKANKTVLLIDADMRKSVTMSNINVDGEVFGLSHYLSGQSDLKEVIYKAGDYENFYVMFTGSFPPNPSELLSTEKFKDMLTTLKKKFDYIIIDTPPIGAVIDAAIIASVCDGAVMVVRANKTSYKAIRTAKAQLEKSKCHILGAVLNGAQTNQDIYYKKYYGKES